MPGNMMMTSSVVNQLLSNKTNDSSIAASFNSSTAYSTGDVVTYSNKLYKFTTDHAAGAWNISDVSETTVAELIGGGQAASIVKSRYTISSSGWSNSTDAGGYYTYVVTLSSALSSSYPPNIYIAGVNDSTFYTDAEKEAYALLEQCSLTTSTTATLYAKTKPTTTFYVFIEGQLDQ